MKHWKLWLIAPMMAACVTLLSGCTKESAKNTECDMLSAWVEGKQYEQYFFFASGMRVDNISSTTTEITFIVKSMENLPEQLPVYFTVTTGASISPASGSMQNFKNGPVTYTVTSESGENSRQYTVVFKQLEITTGNTLLYSFEGVDSVTKSSCQYHVFYETGVSGERNYIWASGNEGVTLIHSNWTPGQFPTRSTNEGYQGKGVCLTTQDAGAMGRMMHKPIAAGNLFIGSFNVDQVLINPLKCTRFGTPVNKEPVKVSGYYKYQPGEVFTDANMNTIEGRTDEASIYAIFFRNQNESGENISLYGDDFTTSPYIVKIGQVASLPPTDEWTRFELTLEGNAPDAEALANFGYSMTLVFSSSKSGDTFEGAIGSTLLIDEVEVTFKQEQ